MTTFRIWSIDQSVLGNGTHRRQDVSFERARTWISGQENGEPVPALAWRTEFLLLYSPQSLAGDDDAIEQLIKASDFAPPNIFPTPDTVEFNIHLRDPRPGSKGGQKAARPAYSVTDNVFGVCWMWDPSRRLTRGLIYGCHGEGSDQMYIILRNVRNNHNIRSNPLALALFALIAEVVTMRTWVRDQGHALMNGQVQTGHHSYANTLRLIDAKGVDLATLSRDVCGLAVNITTSALCLQRIVKLADFIIEECSRGITNLVSADSPSHVKNLVASKTHLLFRTRAWRIRADSLLDEAESWKHKADILVQTVFTLSTQRDQEIGIQIAHDSRTLAQKATKDSMSMKAIAAVTMCFLPGTFVAVSS